MFEKPVSSQDGSPLLALPSEIRTPILKYLVTSEKAIPVAHESDDEPQEVHLAILRVCQQLHLEGISLFIEHNVPRISVTFHREEAWVVNWHNGRDGPVTDINYNEFLRNTIPKFSRLYFEFSQSAEVAASTRQLWRPYIQKGLLTSARWLQRCDLRKKEVTFAFDPEIIGLLRLDNWPVYRYWIFAFDAIRCKKFHFIGMDGQHVTNLTRVVEGRLCIPSLLAASKEIRIHLSDCRHATGNWDRCGTPSHKLESDIQEAAEVCDVVRFMEARAAIMSCCEEFLEEARIMHEKFKAAVARPLFVD